MLSERSRKHVFQGHVFYVTNVMIFLAKTYYTVGFEALSAVVTKNSPF
jgi:hypothetical protein